MKHNALFSLALASLPLAATVLPQAAQAQVVPDNVATVTVLPGWRTQSGAHMAALKITLADGWHTYWRAPGASGIPPSFEWDSADTSERIAFHWPVPTPYVQNDLKYIGYENEVVLPFEYTASADASAQDIPLSGEIHMGVCEDVCLPLTVDFETVLPAGATQADPQIKAALSSQAKALRTATCSAKPISDGMIIEATLRVPDLGPLETAVIEHPDPSVWVSETIATRDGDVLRFESEMVPENAAPFFVDRSQLTLTVIGMKNGKPVAYEAKGCTGG